MRSSVSEGRLAALRSEVARGALRVGIILVVIGCLREVPPPRDWPEASATPFSAGPVRSVGPAYRLLMDARAVVPEGSSVVARQEPPSVVADTHFFKAAVALLPGRDVLPAAVWFRDRTDFEMRASYLVVLGRVEALEGFRKVLETGDGSVWKR